MVGVRGSWFKANAASDIYDFITDEFTDGQVGFQFRFVHGRNVGERRVPPRYHGGHRFQRHEQAFRRSDEEELLPNGSRVPIQQVDRAGTDELFASAKFLLLPRGRHVSSLAWIPNTFVPYAARARATGGITCARTATFVDFVDHHIFTDTFNSEGWAPTFHVMGGTDIQVLRRLVLSFEARYSWQHADLDHDFVDFAPIDLGGFRFGAGIHFAF
jgi:hypothetical protein